jgi:hypothetical protein
MKAPKGQVWMCHACGRWAVDRNDVGDISCYINSVLVPWKKERHVVRRPIHQIQGESNVS